MSVGYGDPAHPAKASFRSITGVAFLNSLCSLRGDPGSYPTVSRNEDSPTPSSRNPTILYVRLHHGRRPLPCILSVCQRHPRPGRRAYWTQCTKFVPSVNVVIDCLGGEVMESVCRTCPFVCACMFWWSCLGATSWGLHAVRPLAVCHRSVVFYGWLLSVAV